MIVALALALVGVGCAHLQPRETFVRGAQGRLHVSDGGRGRAVPVLFVHGNGANLTQWNAQLAHLRTARRAVAIDLRGMGRSDAPANGDYSIDAMADDVQTVADAVHLTRFVIVGHSFGGAVVAAYAAKHPDRVAGVVYADSAGSVNVPRDAAERFVAALRKDRDGVVRQWFAPILKNARPEVEKAVLASVHDTTVDAFTGALAALPSSDVKGNAAAFHGPRLAIVAAGNHNPGSLHAQLPDLPRREIAGVSHWLMMDKPDEFNAILDEFLAGIR